MLQPASQTTIQFTPPHTNSPLVAGQHYSGVIRSQSGGLTAVVAGLKLPVDADSGLQAGQRVLVQVQAQGKHLQLTIQATPAQAASPDNTGSNSALLRTVLQQIGRPELEGPLTTLLPRQAPTSAEYIRALVSSLLLERGTGRDIQQLQQILAQASQQGVLPPDAGAVLSPWLSLTALADAKDWYDLLRRARSERNAAARLAQVIRGEAPVGSLATLKQSLNSLTHQLLDDAAFRNWLRSEGLEDSFKLLANRSADRALGSDVQNLRALDQAYQFMELPLGEEQGYRRLQLHLFSEEASRHGEKRHPLHRTVLDLELSQLGPLWIDLRAQGNQCRCNFQVMTPNLVTQLNDVADELHEKLTDVGFPHAHITASLWNGDREAALLALLSPYQGLDLNA